MPVHGDARALDHGGGACLRLAIARELVEAHGGHLWIEPGPGATVAFGIPAPPATATP